MHASQPPGLGANASKNFMEGQTRRVKINISFENHILTDCLQMQGDLELNRKSEDANLGLPSLKWVSAEQIETVGLSSSVKKVLKLVNEATSKQKKSIKRFFPPKK
jgi:hypothetical protein